ncbi:protein kinase [Faecalicatena acetigenes]|uniref:Protein kinase n=2 Tax=Lachnospiraceae TaxID=186803 RepID=A0ABT2T9C3_9FIRM|nr:leucine-rich repeat domain-containing protein [Faecalicatena acetigenes]MCU6746875.1 protein kinase [Faecalicatena acetigenes]
MQDREGWPAVLKVQSSGRRDTLRQEYHLLQELRHPQIPRPLAYLEWKGKEYLVREYVEGVSLYELVTSQGHVPSNKVRTLTLSVCQALQYLHSQHPPIICRDVKPQNVILDPSGCCHLIDLGAARRHRPEKLEDTVFLGTQVTAPPEQFGYQQTDARSDVYSLGMLMRFLHTGHFDPVSTDSNFRFLDRVIRRCTAFDPKNRYASIRSVYRTLKYRQQRCVIAAAVSIICAAVILCLFQIYTPKMQPPSSLLEDALRQELQLDARASIPIERLDEVEQLLVCGQTLVGTLQEHEELANSTHDYYAEKTNHGDISDDDLELLAQCTNLQILVLDYQQITDLSPLSELPLEYLSLTGNQISNLTPLSALTRLQVLDLGENPVRSAEVLTGLPALRDITLEATGITSVDFFEGSDIQSLNVRSTWVTDFSPLESCSSLSRLIVGELPSGTAETLKGLTNLTELRLYSTPDVDLSYFVGFHKLQNLDLYGSTISHLDKLAQLPTLHYLNVGGTGINELSFLSRLPAITDVDLRKNPLTDLTPLSDCPWLTLLILSKEQQPLAEAQLSHTSFEIQYQ